MTHLSGWQFWVHALRDRRWWSLLVVAVLGIGLAYQVNPPLLFDIGGPDDCPYLGPENSCNEGGDGLTAHWNAPEHAPTGPTYRWTQADSALVLPGLGSGPWAVTLRLAGGRPAPLPPPPITVTLGGQDFAWQTEPGFTERTFTVPHADDAAGTLTIQIHSTPFSPPGDPRRLGVTVDRVQVAPADRSLILPAWPTAAALLISLLCVYLLAVLLTGHPPAALALAAGALLAGLAVLVTRRAEMGLWAPALAGGLLAAVGLAVGCIVAASLGRGQRGGAAFSPHPTPVPAGERESAAFSHTRYRRPLLQIAGLLALAFVVRWGGTLHPQFRSSDLTFQAHRLDYVWGVTQGSGDTPFFAGELPNGTQVPYPSAYYWLLLPAYALLGAAVPAGKGLLLVASSLADALVVLPVYMLARRWGTRAGLGAALLYVFGAAPLQLFTAGNHTNLFAGAVGVYSLAAGARALERGPGAGRWLAAFGVGSLLTLLSHYGVALAFGGVVGTIAVVWLMLAPTGQRSRIWPLLGMFGTAVGLAYFLYYIHFAADMIAQVRGIIERTNPPGPRFTPSALLADVVHWQGGALLLAVVGLILWLARARHAARLHPASPASFRNPQSAVRIVLASWLLASVPIAASALFDRDTIRYNLLALPPLCVVGGVALAGLAALPPVRIAGRRLALGGLLAGALGGGAVLYTLALWATLIIQQYH